MNITPDGFIRTDHPFSRKYMLHETFILGQIRGAFVTLRPCGHLCGYYSTPHNVCCGCEVEHMPHGLVMWPCFIALIEEP